MLDFHESGSTPVRPAQDIDIIRNGMGAILDSSNHDTVTANVIVDLCDRQVAFLNATQSIRTRPSARVRKSAGGFSTRILQRKSGAAGSATPGGVPG
jgi:hypothetical protein